MKPPWISHELPHYESPCYGFSSTSVEAPHPTSTWVGGGKVRWSNWGIQIGILGDLFEDILKMKNWRFRGIFQDFEWPHVEKHMMNHNFLGYLGALWRKKKPFRFQALFKEWYFIHCGVPPPTRKHTQRDRDWSLLKDVLGKASWNWFCWGTRTSGFKVILPMILPWLGEPMQTRKSQALQLKLERVKDAIGSRI